MHELLLAQGLSEDALHTVRCAARFKVCWLLRAITRQPGGSVFLVIGIFSAVFRDCRGGDGTRLHVTHRGKIYPFLWIEALPVAPVSGKALE